MKSISVNLRVQNVRVFSNVEGRKFINLITVENFPKRKEDKETGEIVESITNELVMPLKQFMHTVYLTPNFLQVFFAKCDRQYYSAMSNGEWYSLLLGATLSVTIERYEDGDTFINEISGEEESSDGVTYHTRLTKIKVGLCGRKFAIHKVEDDAFADAMDATIDELENLAPTVHKFTVKAEAEKPAEKPAEKAAE